MGAVSLLVETTKSVGEKGRGHRSFCERVDSTVSGGDGEGGDVRLHGGGVGGGL